MSNRKSKSRSPATSEQRHAEENTDSAVSANGAAFARQLISDYADAIIDTAQVPLLALNRQLRVMHANRIFYQTFRTSAKLMAGLSVLEADGGQWNFPRFRRLLEQLMPEHTQPGNAQIEHTQIDDFELDHTFPTIGLRHLSINARHLPGSGDNSGVLLLAIKDVTEHVETRRALEASQARYRAIAEEQTDLIARFLPDASLIFVNQSFCRFFGRTPEQLIGRSFLEELVAEADRESTREFLAKPLQSQSPSKKPASKTISSKKDAAATPPGVFVKRIEAPAGHYRQWNVRPFLDPTGRITEFQATSRDPAEPEPAHAALLAYQRNVNELTARLISAQEENNKHLARELHGMVSQNLAVVGIRIGEMERIAGQSHESPSHETLAVGLAELAGLIDDLAEKVHQLSRRLHPAILDDLGLATALNEEFLSFSRQSGFPAAFKAGNVPAVLPEDISLCLYRVGQETLWNIARHAGFGKVRGALTGSKGRVSLVIQDSGAGFDVETARQSGRLGLVSMDERVRLVGGTFSVRSVPGFGTRIEARVPIRQATR